MRNTQSQNKIASQSNIKKSENDKLSSILRNYQVEAISLYVGFRYIEFGKQGLKFKIITYFLTVIVAAFLSDKYLGSNFLPKLPNTGISISDAIKESQRNTPQ